MGYQIRWGQDSDSDGDDNIENKHHLCRQHSNAWCFPLTAIDSHAEHSRRKRESQLAHIMEFPDPSSEEEQKRVRVGRLQLCVARKAERCFRNCPMRCDDDFCYYTQAKRCLCMYVCTV